MITAVVRLMRPHHYLKNLFILAPLFFGLKVHQPELLARAATAFLGFSLAASAVYILNDYYDQESDRAHPVKKNRPLAAGLVTRTEALLLMAVCLAGGMAITFLAGTAPAVLTLVYVLVMIAYTVKLKHVALIDVFIIAAGFVLRLFVGAETTGISLSMWIVLITFLLALFLALAKRRDDYVLYKEDGRRTRKVIEHYNIPLLDAAMVLMSSVTVVAYIMYTISPEVIARARTDKLYLTAGFVIFGIMRYMQLTFVYRTSGSPTKLLMHDGFLKASVIGWIAAFALLLYR